MDTIDVYNTTAKYKINIELRHNFLLLISTENFAVLLHTPLNTYGRYTAFFTTHFAK